MGSNERFLENQRIREEKRKEIIFENRRKRSDKITLSAILGYAALSVIVSTAKFQETSSSSHNQVLSSTSNPWEGYKIMYATKDEDDPVQAITKRIKQERGTSEKKTKTNYTSGYFL